MKPKAIGLLALLGLLLVLGSAMLLQFNSDGPGDRVEAAAPGIGDTATRADAGAVSPVDRAATGRNDSGSNEAAQRAFGCSLADFAEESTETDEERIERDQREFYALIDSLSLSTDLEHRLAAAVLKVNDGLPDAIEELDGLLVTMPENPVLHWRLLDACDVRKTYPLCESGAAEAHVIRVLGANGEAWAKIAYYRIKRGDAAGGLDALYNAASAPSFNDYWSSEVALLFRGLAIDTNRAVPARLTGAIGYVAAFPSPELELINQCRIRAANAPD